MKVLITGGAGFIGSHLSELLLEADDEVWALDDLSTGISSNIHHLPGPRRLPSRRRLGALARGRERARPQVRRRLPPRCRRRRPADRRAAGPHAGHERPGHGDGARVLQPLRQAGPRRVELGGLRRPSRPRRRSPRTTAGSTARRPTSVALRRLEGDGRVSCARLPPGAGPRLRHRPPLQHGRAPPERPVRHGHPALRRPGARRRPLEIHGDGTQTRCSATCRTRSARSRG